MMLASHNTNVYFYSLEVGSPKLGQDRAKLRVLTSEYKGNCSVTVDMGKGLGFVPRERAACGFGS